MVGQFPIEVRFASGNNIYGSIAYTSARVHDQGTIFVYVEDDDGDDITQRGLTVRFSGRVENQTGDPQSGVPVIIFLDSYQIPVQNTTLADGSFIIYYQLESSLSIGLLAVTGDVISGTLQVVSTIDYLTINSTTDIQNLEFNATRVMIGETIILTGLIIDDNATGVVGESLDIFLSYQSNTTLVGSVISLLDGNFSFTFTIPGSIPATDPTVQFEVRFSGTPYLGLSNNSRTLDVFTNATLLIEVDSRVYYWFDDIPVDGTLIDNFGRPLANRPIQININGTNRYSAYSDTQGSVSFSLNFAPPQTTNYSIQLLHETITTVYSPIRTITVEVQQPMQIIPPWHIIIPIIIIVVVIIVGVVLYRYWKRRPRRPSTPSVDASAMLTTLRGLLTDKKYQETLIYAFRMFETIVQAKLGLFRDPSITLREFGNLAVAHGQLNTRTMEVFIRGVEEARFSDHPISYNSALMSLNAFASIYNSLTGGNLRFVTQEQQPEQSEGQSD